MFLRSPNPPITRRAPGNDCPVTPALLRGFHDDGETPCALIHDQKRIALRQRCKLSSAICPGTAWIHDHRLRCSTFACQPHQKSTRLSCLCELRPARVLYPCLYAILIGSSARQRAGVGTAGFLPREALYRPVRRHIQSSGGRLQVGIQDSLRRSGSRLRPRKRPARHCSRRMPRTVSPVNAPAPPVRVEGEIEASSRLSCAHGQPFGLEQNSAA